MRTGRLLVICVMVCSVLLLGSTGVGTASATGVPPLFTCVGTVSPFAPQTIPFGTYDRLSMPPGSACLIVSPVKILHAVVLGGDSSLDVQGGSFSLGSLTVGADAAFGNLSFGAAPIHISGPVWVNTRGYFVVGTETPGGPIVSSILGAVTATGASSVQIHNTQVTSYVTVQGGGADNPIAASQSGPCASNFSDLEDNIIGGDVTEVGYHGVWAGILRNRISGSMTFSNNVVPACYTPFPGSTIEYDIGSNAIDWTATCNSNVPAPNLGDSAGYLSRVRGRILGNQAATCAGVANGVSGPPV